MTDNTDKKNLPMVILMRHVDWPSVIDPIKVGYMAKKEYEDMGYIEVDKE